MYDNVFDDLDTTPVDFHYSEPCDISPDPPYDSYAATDPFTSLAGYDGTCNSMPGWNPSFNPSSAPGCKINPMYNEPGLGYGASYGSGARGASRQIMCRQMTHESRLSLYALASTGRGALSIHPFIAQTHMPHSRAALLACFFAFISTPSHCTKPCTTCTGHPTAVGGSSTDMPTSMALAAATQLCGPAPKAPKPATASPGVCVCARARAYACVCSTSHTHPRAHTHTLAHSLFSVSPTGHILMMGHALLFGAAVCFYSFSVFLSCPPECV